MTSYMTIVYFVPGLHRLKVAANKMVVRCLMPVLINCHGIIKINIIAENF